MGDLSKSAPFSTPNLFKLREYRRGNQLDHFLDHSIKLQLGVILYGTLLVYLFDKPIRIDVNDSDGEVRRRNASHTATVRSYLKALVPENRKLVTYSKFLASETD